MMTEQIEAVLLSTTYVWREPGSEIFLQAARRMGVHLGCSAYVGDRPLRYVAGARQAGSAPACIIQAPGAHRPEPYDASLASDHVVHSSNELLMFFPLLGQATEED